MEAMSDKQRRDLERRVEAVLGGHGAHSAFAEALGVERSTLLRVYTGETARVPGYLEAVIEFLEALPREQWPQRWRK